MLQSSYNYHNKSSDNTHIFLLKQSLKALLCSRIESRSIRGLNNDSRAGYLVADEPRSIDSAVGCVMRQEKDSDCERYNATINGATATVDGTMFAKYVYAGATAISGWLLCESRR